MLKLSLDALQILDAIDRRGSFAAAGKALHKVPSTISYTVSKLEEDLGVQLFDRIGPRAHLTAAGEALLEEGRHLLRAARELEMRVRRVASGWEAELTVAVDAMFPPALLAEDVRAFTAVAEQTRVRLVSEALSGTWEALLDRRADLLVGAAGEGPSGGGYVVEPMGVVRFVFAVAPSHPLATAPEPLGREVLAAHCAIAVADSARRLLPRTVGLLMGQDTVTVPDTASKFRLQCAGLGFGFLPEPYVRQAVREGRLVIRQVDEPKPDETFWLAWRTGEEGAGLRWWRERMQRPQVIEGWWPTMATWLGHGA
ncbi:MULTISPECIES: LysR family transcriptional regulator [Stenotrophomonas]|jgi:DNA-binding transcriptional LysR family regulator|uniref:LysR family transcriptional regulator n=2 Tax=Stenotrophomonas TaxID=40323 RepID=A0A4V3RIL8_STEMA|nr:MULTISPECIES: LysR family transcriptional regulator [Stenotrophomonas]MBD3826034.1 LysR family transcriptional regulator [Stenotrophomonas sp.]QIO87780.1 LysR family transcriptional regulator [Stenotrophomonas rhizophila]TGY32620.1 LysR family transcriptional regulator [Stenotrophomonas maltophilia]HBS62108.1 LysR family transcriptional regulator [Stenotrophomonas sp.]